MTHPTDEELDALEKRLSEPWYQRQSRRVEEEFDAADAITILRTQLAEANARADRAEAALAEIKQTLGAPDDWHPVNAVKALKQSNDRAEQRVATLEAALAAQIEVDAGIADALYRMALKDSDDDLSSHWKSHKASAYGTASQAIRNQPHDRTALDRMLAEAREKALREAAQKATSFLVGDPSNGIPLRNPMAHEIADAILAMIEKPDAAR